MKHFAKYLLFFLLYTQTIVPEKQNHTTQKNGKKNIEFYYNYYFIIKEICKAYIHSFFIDITKLDQSQIVCSQCHTKFKLGYAYAYFISQIDKPTLIELLNMIYSQSPEKISQFLVQKYQDGQVPCDKCRQYHGWYIVEHTQNKN